MRFCLCNLVSFELSLVFSFSLLWNLYLMGRWLVVWPDSDFDFTLIFCVHGARDVV